MKVLVLGSAAGGGFPQWNCNCSNSSQARKNPEKAKPRTQSSRTAKNNTSVQTKQVAVKSINSPRSHRVNKQWEKNTTLGMYSSFPSKTNKYSRKNKS